MPKKEGYHRKTKSLPSSAGIYTPTREQLILQDPKELSIGLRIRRERYLRKYTLDDMAQYLGISTSYLGAMERGARPVSRKMMDLLHEKLGISYDYLLEGLAITGAAISKYVRESSSYSVNHNLNVLIGVCTDEELAVCYEMIHAYLTRTRSKKNG